MQLNRTLVVLGLGVAALAGGCQQSGGEARKGHHHGRHTSTDQDAMLPGRVLAAFRREFRNAEVKEARQLTHADGAVHWDVQYVTEDGQTKRVELDDDGNVVP